MKQWDVVVVGSGISSLTCAAILAKKGKSVCVLEKYVKPGGYLHCFKRFGQRFDTGAHYVGAMNPGEAFHTLLNYLNVYDPDLFIPLNEEAFDVFRFPSFETRLAKGVGPTIEALCEVFPEEREGIRKYFELVSATARLFPTYEFREDYDEMALSQVLETPLSSIVTQFTRNPRLQSVLYAYCALHGVRPEDISFGFHSIVTDSLLRGAYGFRHGGDGVTDKFVEVIERHGGKVISKCGVSELRAENGEVKSVVTERGEEIRGDWVISGIHPKATFRLVTGATFSPAFRGRLEGLPESGGVFGVYAACRGSSNLRPDRNYYFFDHEEPAGFFKLRRPDERPGLVFAARPDRVNETLNSSYPILFHSSGPMEWFEGWRDSRYGKRAADYEEFKERQAESIIGFVDSHAPGLESSIERYVTSTPLSNMFFNGSEDGSAYGIYHAIRYSGARALGPRTHLKNLLLTGQSCLFPGLLGAAISGLRTAGSIVGIKGLLRELRQVRESA